MELNGVIVKFAYEMGRSIFLREVVDHSGYEHGIYLKLLQQIALIH